MKIEEKNWSEANSQAYRSLSQYAVPERERQIAIITQLVQASAASGGILDLCCGEGLLTKSLHEAVPQAAIYAYDGSSSMLEMTRNRLGDSSRLITREIDIAASDWRQMDRPLKAVVSSLAIHHLDGDGKQTLFTSIFDVLASGGVFVLADIIRPANRIGSNIAAEMWDEEARRRSIDLDGNLDGFELFEKEQWNYFRHGEDDPMDKPSTIVDLTDWLRAARFENVDLHWLIAGQTIISAWKPS